MYRCKKWLIPLWSNIMLLLACFLLGAKDAHATHAMGADITYECIGPNQYRVTLNLYRDCIGVNMSTSEVLRYRSTACNVNSTVTLTRVGTPVDITPLCATATSRCASSSGTYGVQRWTYQGVITLANGCTDWILSHDLCCRNNAITTLSGPGGQSMYVQATLNNTLSPCNNSPVFLNEPSAFACNGQTNFYNQGAVDPDGDSLRFALVNCFRSNNGNSGPGISVGYATGRSGVSPLAGTITFDPATGAIAYAPSQTQVGVLCVEVQEYRNGVLIGTTRRDIQFTIINCNNQLPIVSGIQNPTGGTTVINYDMTACFNTQLCFNITASDANAANRLIMSWNNAIPGATFTVQPGTNPRTARFCWTPTSANIGINTFTVTVKDDACPLNGSNTYTYSINVVDNPNTPVTVGADQSICAGQSVNLSANTTDPDVVRYFWTPTTGLSNPNIANPVATPTVTTAYTVTAVYRDSCRSQATQTVTVRTAPAVSVVPANATACPGANLTIAASTGTAGATFQWFDENMASMGTGAVSGSSSLLNITLPGSAPDTVCYTVVVTDPVSGCATTRQACYYVGVPPTQPECINIYVSPTGLPTNAGTFISPVDIETALQRVACNNAVIKMAQGTYIVNNELTIPSYTTIEGGFDPTNLWTKSSTAGATTIRRTTSNPISFGGTDHIAVFMGNNAVGFRLQDLTLTTDNASSASMSTYGVHLNNCSNYALARVQISAGNAGAGANGSVGVNGVVGSAGNAGTAGVSTNTATPGGNGGAGGSSAAIPSGGLGGTGNGTAGLTGSTATAFSRAGGAGGGGGAGGQGPTAGGASGASGGGGRPTTPGFTSGASGVAGGTATNTTGNPGTDGNAGASGTSGANGANGSGVSTSTFFYTVGVSGAQGQHGTGGSGGSGGGGGGGRISGGTGSGGSGGGGGGEGGEGGYGGTNGGASFGIYLVSNGANGQLLDCNVTAGAAGAGGIGGNGGTGGAGGTGAARVAVASGNGGRSGRGGDGGSGGAGGRGGDGIAGTSAVVNVASGSALATSITTFNLAAQPTIRVENVNCANASVSFSAPSAVVTAWDFDAVTNLANPATSTLPSDTTQYSAVGRYTPSATVGGVTHTYTGFHNIAFDKAFKPDILTNANVIAPDTFQLCVGDMATFASSRYADTAVWNFDGAIANPGFTTLSVPATAFNTPGFFQITLTLITDCCGDSPTDTIYLYVDPRPNPTAGTNPTICEGETGTLTISGLAATDSVVWSPSNTLNIQNQSTAIASPITTTVYTASVYSVITLGGRTRMACPRNVSFTVTVNPRPRVNMAVNNVLCTNDGSVTASVTNLAGPFNYTWSNGVTANNAMTSSITGLAAGTYTVTVSTIGSNVCDTVMTAFVFPAASQVSAFPSSVTEPSCVGFADGAATISATNGTAPYTFAWSNGATAATATGLAAGTYTITVTDGNGCRTTTTVDIFQPQPLTISLIDTTNPTCVHTPNGMIEVEAVGGTGPYVYNWNPNATTTAIATGVGIGTYNITVTDNHNCTVSRAITLSPVYVITTAPASTAISCNGGTSQITVNASGGSGLGTYTYGWSGGNSATFPTNQDVVGGAVAASGYGVTVTDANGCSVSNAITVTQPSAITTTVTSQTNVLCFGNSTGAATAAASGGTGALRFTWSAGGQTTATATGLAAGTHTVTVQDANNCVSTAVVTITQPAAAVGVTTAVSQAISCNGGNNGRITATPTGGTGAYTFAWSNGQTAATATGLAVGTYTVTTTDANGCQATSTLALTQPTAVTATVASQTNVLCRGNATGTATAAGNGGTGAYTFAWSNGQTAATATGLAAGTYTVSVRDVNSCLATASVTITQPATNVGVTATVSSNYNGAQVSCNGSSDGQATATASGGTGSRTFVWSIGGQTTAIATGLAANTIYTVTATDANGCQATTTVTLSQPSVITPTIASQTNVLCFGNTTGAATAAGAGGTGAYTFAWSNGQTTATATGLAAGTYTVTVRDANSCARTTTVTITQPAAAVGVTTAVTAPLDCNGDVDGQIRATAAGGVSPYTYVWSNTQTTAIATGLAAGTYTVTTTDANGCQATSTITLTQPTAITVTTASQTNVLCRGNATGAATVSSTGGTGSHTYVWSNGQVGATATGLVAGTYTVTATDANNCAVTRTITITQPATNVGVTATVSSNYNGAQVSCNGSSDGQATATASGGTGSRTFVWSIGGQTTAIATGLAANTIYTVTATDANGCQATTTVTLSQPSVITPTIASQTNVLCFGNTTGAATAAGAGGTGAYTFAWSNGQTTATATGLAAGTYTVTVRDANSCARTTTVTITQPAAAVGVTTAVTAPLACNGNANGQITATSTGGVSPYTYVWSNTQTTATATGLAAGTYTVTTTDANGCQATSTITLTQPTAITVATASQTNVLCRGNATGAATVSSTGGTGSHTYVWSNGQVGATATGLVAGTYTVTATDANNCAATRTITITQPATNVGVTATAASLYNGAQVSCNGSSDGQATATASGGTGSRTFVWSIGGQTTAIATGLAANTIYTVTATDANGCQATTTVTLSQPSVITPTIASQTNVLCFGNTTGAATAAGAGGTGAYTFAWSNGQTSATATGLAAGTYTVTVRDANSCARTTTVTITQPAAAVGVTTAVTAPLACNGNANGQITATSTGGVSPYTYVWSNTQTTATATGLAAGTYTVTTTDANGCQATSTITLTQPTAITVATASQTNVLCRGNATGAATVSSTGGTGSHTYVWSNGQVGATATGLVAGTYTVTATDANNCATTRTIIITQPTTNVTVTAAVISNYNGAQVSCNGATDGQATATAGGGTGAIAFAWSNGQATATAVGLAANTTYTVTATDANGCQATTIVTLSQPSVITPTIASQTNVLCFGNATGAATVSSTGGTGAHTYVWSNGQTSTTATGLATGTYTVTVRDVNSCSRTATVTITQPASAVSVTATVTKNISCNGGSDGQVTATGTGGVSGFTFVWNNGQTTATATGLATGTYTVTATDANGCATTTSVLLSQPTSVSITVAAQTNVACRGAATGRATVTATGGTGSGYTFIWSAPISQTTAVVTGLTAGTYTVTGFDANGCSATTNVVITEPATNVTVATAVISNYNGAQISCNGAADGQATANAAGGTGALSYLWSNGQTTATATGLAVGSYCVTATDANNCIATSCVNVSHPTAIASALVTVTNVGCRGNATGSATVSSTGGTGAHTYNWSNGQAGTTATGLAAGTYTVTVVDANGCSTTRTVIITEPANSLSVNSAVVSNYNGAQLTCAAAADARATAVGSGGTPSYSFLWDDGQIAATATGLAAGTHCVTITDANGCVANTCVTVTAPPTLAAGIAAQTNVLCRGNATGTATANSVGGTGSATFVWSNGQTGTTATGLAAGVYSVTATDINNCTSVANVTITQPATNVTVSGLVTSSYNGAQLSCATSADGSAQANAAGGTGLITYVWSNGQNVNIATGLAAGTHHVTATDANGCAATVSVTITPPTAVTASVASVSNVLCRGNATGAATATAAGGTAPLGYGFVWSNGQTGTTATGLAAGVYSVTATDANSCSNVTIVTITEPATNVNVSTAMTSSFNGFGVSCATANNGIATANANGGTGTITYVWSNGQTAATATGLAAGTYCVTATDANACADVACVTMTAPAQLDATVAGQTNISCFGAATGSASLNAVGGVFPYTYLWATGATSANVAGLVAGTYCATVTDANGCADVVCVTLTQPALGLNVSANITTNYNGQDVSCFGANDGAALATAVGGTGAITFRWDITSQTTASATGLADGTYCVVATDANGCRDTACVTLVEPAQLVPSIASVNNVLCRGNATGSATAAATGGVPNYDFVWEAAAGSQTTPTATGLAAGIYSVTVSDQNGCAAAISTTITQPALNVSVAAAAASNYNGQHISCNGALDGQALATAAGGTGAFSYQWDGAANGQTTALATGLAAGTYCVTVVDANGCSATNCVTLNQPTLLVAGIASTTDVLCRGNATGAATATAVGGTTPYNYIWQAGQTTASIGNQLAGSYNVTVVDANGCASVAVATITEPNSNVNVTAAVTSNYNGQQVSCNGATDGQATAAAVDGVSPYTFVWNIGGQTTATATGLAAGTTYVVTATDANGCQDTAQVRLVAPAQLVANLVNQTNVLCSGNVTGAATVGATGGTAPYTYAWSNGQNTATATGLAAGAYSATATDANGCTGVINVIITQPTSPVAAVASMATAPNCSNSADGSVTVNANGGTPAYTYLWANGATTQIATGVAAGTQCVTVTDANGCVATSCATVTAPASVIAAIASTTPATCRGTATGAALAQGNGGTAPYTFVWSNGTTTANIGNLLAGSYNVTVTDARGCASIATAVITQSSASLVVSAAVSSNYNGSNITCFGAADGQATATAVGGATPYAYLWNVANQTTATITGLAHGSYIVTITDANGCAGVATVSVVEPAAVTANAVGTDAPCTNAAGGSATSTPTGGTAPYTYAWSNGQNAATATGLAAGVYSVTVTDANGCTDVENVVIGQPANAVQAFTNIATTYNGAHVSCFGNSDGSVRAVGFGGVAPYTYAWSTSSINDTLFNLAAGIYTVTVTDANGCQAANSITVTNPAQITASVASTISVTCRNTATGSATAAGAGGTGAYTFQWDAAARNQTTATATGLAAGAYNVTVTDANGCAQIATAVITQPAATVDVTALVTSNFNGAQISCNGAADGAITATVLGGTAPYAFVWSDGQTSSVATGLVANAYCVTATDVNGCSDVACATVSEPAVLTAIVVSTVDVDCRGNATGEATINATGGTGSGAYAFQWDAAAGNAITSTVVGLVVGTYCATVTDLNGCVDVICVNINEPATALTANAVVVSNYNNENVSCNGANDGKIVANGIGGTAPYTYLWSIGNQPADTAYNVPAGVHTVTVTDNNGCVTTAQVTVTQPTAITTSIASQSNVSCNGTATGTATAQAAGGTGAYTFVWSDGQTTAQAINLVAGSYTVTATDANNCHAIASVVITQPASTVAASVVVTSNYNGQQVSCVGSNDGIATANGVGGLAPYAYQWSALAGSQTTAAATGLSAGLAYDVTVTDASGCFATATVTLVNPTAVSATITAHSNPSCNGSATGSATAAGAGGVGNFGYQWAASAGSQTTATATGLVAGVHPVTVTDANGCAVVIAATITQPSTLLTVNTAVATPYNGQQVSCNGAANGSATTTATGGVAPYQFVWSAAAQTTATATGLAAGTYAVTVTDSLGCVQVASVTISEPSTLALSIVNQFNVNCRGESTGQVTVLANGATPGYRYSLNGGAFQSNGTFTTLAAGAYTIVAEDLNFCTVSVPVLISEPATGMSVTATVTSTYNGALVSCDGACDGTADAVVVGGTAPYTYQWSGNGQTTATATGLCAGTYAVTVRDANGCSDNAVITVTEPTPLVANVVNTTNVICSGTAAGTATLTASGGTGVYTYTVGTVSNNTGNFTNLLDGTHVATVTDANGCSVTTNFTILAPPALVISSINVTSNYNGSQISCHGANDGAATVVAAGGTGTYTFRWDNGQTTFTATGLSAAHTVTVTDQNGCVAVGNVTLTEPAILDAFVQTQTNVGCNGASTGALVINANGGTPNYTFNIGNGAQANGTFTGLAAGAYCITVVDINSCSDVICVTVTQNSAVTATATITTNYNGQQTSCANSADATAQLTVSGGTAPYSFAWANGATSAIVSGLSAGTYTVTITDGIGCVSTTIVTVTAPASINVAVANQTNVTCNGQPTGAFTVNATGGVPAYQYSINNGITFTNTVNYTNLPAATYNVIVRDANGCQDTTQVTITQPAAVQGLISNQVDVSCNGTADGRVTVTGTGGTAPYLYDFQTSGIFTPINTFTRLTAGVYTVRVRDAQGCIGVVPVTITQPSVLAATVTTTNPTCVNTCNGSIQVTATGGTTAYQYSIDGINFQNGSGFTNLCAGGYTVRVRDAQGCTTSVVTSLVQPAAVTVNANVTSNFNSYNVSCNGAADGTATAAVSGGAAPYTIVWNPSGATTNSVTGLSAGVQYIVQATDANGCVGADTVVLTQPAPLAATIFNQTNVSCAGQTNGAVSIAATPNTGVGPYTYNIGTGANNSGIFTSLAAGTYTVTVSDANLCSVTVPVIITEPASLAITSLTVTSNYNGQQVSCNGSTNGSASVAVTGGTGTYSYVWSANGQTASTATGLAAGTHTVVVTDANGCTISGSVTVTQPTALTATVTTDSAGCNGAADGQAVITAAGGTAPYVYTINNGAQQSGGTFTGLAAGTYTLAAIDANGCTASQVVRIFDASGISVNATVTSSHNGQSISCNGGNDGSASVTATGGSGSFTFVWSNNATATSITGLVAGTYTVTATDILGCAVVDTVVLTQPAAISMTVASQTNATCGGNNDASATVQVVSGGVAPYTFAISGGFGTQPTGTFTSLTAGAYTVTVTDANGCTATTSLTITEPTPLSVTLASTNVSCFGLNDGTATATVAGGTPFSNGGFQYSWNTTAITRSVGNLAAGTYRVTVSDANGCTATAAATITELPAVEIASVSVTDVDCNGATNGAVTITANGGSGSYEYSKDGGVTWQTANSFVGLTAGTYSIVIRDANNQSCDDVQTVQVLGNNGLVVTVNTDAVTCAGQTNGTATAVTTGGAGSYTYVWSNGQTSQTATGLAANFRDSVFIGTPYAITVTDGNGCTATVANIAIATPDTLNATAAATANVLCFGGADGAATVTVAGGNGGFTFVWSNGATTATITGLEAFNYTVIVTDSLGCTDTATVAITEPTFPLVAYMSGDTTSCYGTADGIITIDTVSGGTPFANGGYEYSLNANGPFGSAAVLSQGLPAGNYTVYVRDSNNCRFAVDSLVIAQPADVIVTAFNDATIDLGETVNLYATVNQLGIDSSRVFWYYIAGDDTVVTCVGGNCLNNYTPLVSDLYETRRFFVDLGNGCGDTSSVLIEVDLRQSVFIPNAFTPNGDGNNDVITVFGSTDVQLVEEFMIFDRWGELVHEASQFAPGDMNSGWNGSFKGKPMNPAVFVFYAKVKLVNGTTVIRKGDITLIR